MVHRALFFDFIDVVDLGSLPHFGDKIWSTRKYTKEFSGCDPSPPTSPILRPINFFSSTLYCVHNSRVVFSQRTRLFLLRRTRVCLDCEKTRSPRSLLNENCWENSRMRGRKKAADDPPSPPLPISKRLSVGRCGWRKTERSIAGKKGRQINGLSCNDLRSEEVWERGRGSSRGKRGRELHFNGPSAYVKVFGGFQRGKNPGRSPLGIRPSQRNRHFVRIPAIVVPRAPIFHSTRCIPSVSHPP